MNSFSKESGGAWVVLEISSTLKKTDNGSSLAFQLFGDGFLLDDVVLHCIKVVQIVHHLGCFRQGFCYLRQWLTHLIHSFNILLLLNIFEMRVNWNKEGYKIIYPWSLDMDQCIEHIFLITSIITILKHPNCQVRHVIMLTFRLTLSSQYHLKVDYQPVNRYIDFDF